MLSIKYNNFNLKIADIDRANLIFVSLPLEQGIITLRLNFNKISEIAFYYEQLFQLAKVIQIRVSKNTLSAYDEAFRKIDNTAYCKAKYKVSRSIFSKIGDSMAAIGYSLNVNELDLSRIDDIIIPKFNLIADNIIDINN